MTPSGLTTTSSVLTVLVTVDTTAAILAGCSYPPTAPVDVDLATLTPEEREELARLTSRGLDRTLYASTLDGTYLSHNPTCLPTAEGVVGLLREGLLRRRAQAEQRTQRQAQAEQAGREAAGRALALPVEQWVERDGAADLVITPYSAGTDRASYLAVAGVAARLNEAAALAEALTLQRRREAAAVEAQAEAEAAAALAATAAAISSWVADHGTANQKARHAAGLLPQAEVLAEMEEGAYAVLSDWPRYERIVSADLASGDEADCTEQGEDGHDMSCTSSTALSVDAPTWDAAQRLQALLPDGNQVEVRVHHCTCDRRECHAGAVRYGLAVRLSYGQFRFRREYALS